MQHVVEEARSIAELSVDHLEEFKKFVLKEIGNSPLVLEELSIINGTIEIEKLNLLNYLKYLQISYSNIIDNKDITINTLEEIYIDNTNIFNFDFLNNLLNLKRISIDENQYNNNKELFNNLMKKNVLVLNENMVEFGGENNEI